MFLFYINQDAQQILTSSLGRQGEWFSLFVFIIWSFRGSQNAILVCVKLYSLSACPSYFIIGFYEFWCTCRMAWMMVNIIWVSIRRDTNAAGTHRLCFKEKRLKSGAAEHWPPECVSIREKKSHFHQELKYLMLEVVWQNLQKLVIFVKKAFSSYLVKE